MDRKDFLKAGIATSLSFVPGIGMTNTLIDNISQNSKERNSAAFPFKNPLKMEALCDGNWFSLPSNANRLEWESHGVNVSMKVPGVSNSVYLSAPKVAVRKIRIIWDFKIDVGTSVLNDQWERSYGDLSWKHPNQTGVLPWYFLYTNNEGTTGIGVKTGCSALCWWSLMPGKLTLTLDVRNGGSGVLLGNRILHMADLESYKSISGENAFQAAGTFCKLLCDKPLIPSSSVYGINDWYYAYGKSSEEEIIRNCIYFSSLGADSQNKPFCLIDAGWAKKAEGLRSAEISWSENQLKTEGSRYKNMATLASRINLEGFRPGIWVRPLCASLQTPSTQVLPFAGERAEKSGMRILDPSISENINLIQKYFSTYQSWGYEMIKHDFSTWDLFGYWGFDMLKKDITDDGWHFNDRSKTSAEIVLELYSAIRQASGNATVIGCNTLSHLAAGKFELQRTGDDTSGKEWDRTRKMGINTLAFRMPQHNHFYALDADCVGLTTEIPWSQNRQWLDLLSRSGTPLFISASTEALTPEVRSVVKEAFIRSSHAQAPSEPLDWEKDAIPRFWKFGDAKIQYHWS